MYTNLCGSLDMIFHWGLSARHKNGLVIQQTKTLNGPCGLDGIVGFPIFRCASGYLWRVAKSHGRVVSRGRTFQRVFNTFECADAHNGRNVRTSVGWFSPAFPPLFFVHVHFVQPLTAHIPTSFHSWRSNRKLVATIETLYRHYERAMTR